jgi:uncharacterized repeat protein (TIGR01451 family)/LPXTG-motif cell wall-anchored protein
MSLIRRAPKRLSAAVLMIAVAVIVPAAVFAWGPDRPTYTVNNPADHITFNSITNNPNVGDERNFVVVKDAANTADGGWQDDITVQPGKEYLVRVYVHNNAASSLNLTATNTRVTAAVPSTIGKNVSISGYVSADNATPGEIWDDISFNNTKDFSLAYVPGSAQIWNNGYAQNGAALPDSIVTSTGAQIGYEGPNGNVPGCFQYANYVYFKVKPQFGTNFTFTKEVSKHGENKWVENYKAQPGEVVDYLLQYKNTGDTQQNDVTFRDTLPAGMTYVNGSTVFGNSNFPAGKKASDNIANGTGINVGSYLPGANAWAIFSAKAPANDTLPKCGANELVNTGKVTTTGYSLQDTANVTVDKTCQPGQISVCELSTKKVITIKESDFDASKHSKDLGVCVELPQTGPAENIVAIVGLGALIASLVYYVASRKALNQ